jgi:galactokinase
MYPDCVLATFKKYFGNAPEIIIRAPGRINLIGEHTDYNGGYVLPAAIDKAIYFAVSPNANKQCHFVAHDLGESFETDLTHLVPTQQCTWANYLMGVLAELQNRGSFTQLRGVNVVFGGDLPSGGGVSSSAAIENGIGFAVNELFKLGLTRLDLLKVSQQAEHHFIGLQCGIMDMFASMMGRSNCVMRLDCQSLEYQYFPFDGTDYQLVLCNTQVKHALVDSAYNTRRQECQEGVHFLQQFDPTIQNLRDVSLKFLKKYQTQMNPTLFRRCKYVVEEMQRVEKACIALSQQDFTTLGKLMFETHQGLKKDYEVSCPELDFLVHHSQKLVLGARMMGGGFGGCTINLMPSHQVAPFISTIQPLYQKKFHKNLPCYIVTPQNGVEILNPIHI